MNSLIGHLAFQVKQALSDKIFGKTVTVEQETVDRYGRLVSHVYVAGRHVNRELVRRSGLEVLHIHQICGFAGASKSPPSAGFACGSKRTCGQLSSCVEAKFYLMQCGLSRLNGDKDWVPYKSLCR